MKKTRLLALCISVLLLTLSIVEAAVPQTVNFQGYLTNTGGVPQSGSHNMIFRLYDDPTAGAIRWETSAAVAVTVTTGVYNVVLGASPYPFSANLFDTYPNLYLEITVNGELMTPRVKLDSAGFAIKTGKADTATDADTLDGSHASAFATTVHSHSTAGQVADTALSSNVALLDNAQTITGVKNFNPTGTTPFTVAAGKTTVVTNLNADQVDGLHSSSLMRIDGSTSQTVTGTKTFSSAPSFSAAGAPFTVTGSTVVTNLNADQLDGRHDTDFSLSGHTHNFDASYVNVSGDTMTGSLVLDTGPNGNLAVNEDGLTKAQGGNLTISIANNAADTTLTVTNPDPIYRANMSVEGSLSATSLSGDGSGLSNVNITSASGTLPVTNGGTGATTAANARTNLGLGALSTLSSVSTDEIADGSIMNADIGASAAIADTKLAVISSAGKVSDTALTSNVALLNSTQTFSGAKTFSSAVTSTVTTGTAPFTVASTTTVTNLSADFVDNLNASSFVRGDVASTITSVKTFNPSTGSVPFVVDATKNFVVANLNADKLDGYDSTAFADAAHTHNYDANYVNATGDTMTGSLVMNTGAGAELTVYEDKIARTDNFAIEIGSSGATATLFITNPDDTMVANVSVEGSVIASGFSGNGSGLTGVTASGLSAGTYANALTLSSASNSFTGSGAGLTSLNATNLSSGTVNDLRLSSNVDLLNTTQTVSGAKTFSNNTLLLRNSGNTFSTTLSSGTTTAARTITLPDVTGTAITTGNLSSITTTGTITTGTWNATAIAPTYGGLGINTSAVTSGAIPYTSGTGTWATLPKGTDGQVLKLAAGVPAWGGAGTVTSVATGTGLTGGPVTGSGTISIDTAVVPQLTAANSFTTGPQTLNAGGVGGNVGLIVKGAASQWAHLQQWQDSTGTSVATVSPAGIFTGNGSGLTNVAAATATSATTANTANAFTLNPTDCGAGAFAYAIDASGNLTCSTSGSSLTGLNPSNISAGTAGISVTGNAETVTNGAYVNAANSFTTGPQTLNAGASGNKALIVKGAASQTANLQEWQNSASTVVASVSPSGGFAGNGSSLTNVTASGLSAGTYANAVTFSSGSNSFTGSGSGLTSLNATNLSSGAVADARLSTNVDLLNTAQTFTAAKTFNDNMLQLRNTGNTFSTILTAPSATTARTIFLPDASGTAITTGNLTSITSTGTVTSGTWNATAIGTAYGGTGATSAAAALSNLGGVAIGGNTGALTIGTNDSNALTLEVNNVQAFRIEPNATSPNIIGGHSVNTVTAGAYGAVIAGGGYSTWSNRITDNYGFVGGGFNNQAGDGAGTTGDREGAAVVGGSGNTASAVGAFVGGGGNNTASGNYSFVGGGLQNTATNFYATVAGGQNNSANEAWTFAAGNRAKANHQGAFVWADTTAADFASTGNNQFLIRASGGVGINTTSPTTALEVNGTVKATSFTGSGSGLTGVKPVVATATLGSATYLTNTCASIISIPITVPAAGTVVVTGNLRYGYVHATGTTDSPIFRVDTSVSCISGLDASVMDVPSAYPTANGATQVPLLRNFSVSSSGTYTYYVNAYMASGYTATTDTAGYITLTAVWYPN